MAAPRRSRLAITQEIKSKERRDSYLHEYPRSKWGDYGAVFRSLRVNGRRVIAANMTAIELHNAVRNEDGTARYPVGLCYQWLLTNEHNDLQRIYEFEAVHGGTARGYLLHSNIQISTYRKFVKDRQTGVKYLTLVYDGYSKGVFALMTATKKSILSGLDERFFSVIDDHEYPVVHVRVAANDMYNSPPFRELAKKYKFMIHFYTGSVPSDRIWARVEGMAALIKKAQRNYDGWAQDARVLVEAHNSVRAVNSTTLAEYDTEEYTSHNELIKDRATEK